MQSRYQVSGMDTAAGPHANGAVLRIEPVRAQRDDATYECVAENGVGDAVTAVATLTVFEGKLYNLNIYTTTASLAELPNERKWTPTLKTSLSSIWLYFTTFSYI